METMRGRRRRKPTRRLAAAALALAGALLAIASAVRAGAGTSTALIGIDDLGVLYAFALDDPATVRRIASVPSPDPNDSPTSGCDRWPTGGDDLLCIARRANAAVFRLRLAGGTQVIGAAGAPTGTVFRDLVTDTATGEAFAVADRPDGPALFAVDAGSGRTTLIGDLFAAPSTNVVNAIAVAASGTLIGVDRTADRLLAIDRASGLAADIGPLGVDVDTYLGLDVDEANGDCWLVGLEATGGLPRLWACDPATGALTELAEVGSAVPGIVLRFATGSVRPDPYAFADGFESGDVSAWSAAVP